MVSNKLLRAASVGVMALGFTGPGHAEIWLEDPTTGCEIWSDGVAADQEIATWSGACIDGKAGGIGVLVAHDPKGLLLVYNGEMLSGKADGAGVLRFRNDTTGEFDRYVGGFEDSLPMGDGIFESSEGWRLEAEFNGAFDTGSGTLRVYSDEEGGNDAFVRGNFKDGDLIGSATGYYESKNGEAYLGDIENGAREGVGTLIHTNDDAYVGEFEKGKASGAGTYDAVDGSRMVGIYINGAPNGPGSYIAANGDVYQGIFEDGKPEGMILVTRADGTQSVETWKNGEKQQ